MTGGGRLQRCRRCRGLASRAGPVTRGTTRASSPGASTTAEDLDHGPVQLAPRPLARSSGWAWAESDCLAGAGASTRRTPGWPADRGVVPSTRAPEGRPQHDGRSRPRTICWRSLAEPASSRSDRPWFTHHILDLAGLGAGARAVAGYAFRPVEPGEADARAACHRASWSDVDLAGLHGGLPAADGGAVLPPRPRLGGRRARTARWWPLLPVARRRHGGRARRAGRLRARSTGAAGSPGRSAWPGSTRPAPAGATTGLVLPARRRRLPGAGPRLPLDRVQRRPPDDNARATRHAHAATQVTRGGVPGPHACTPCPFRRGFRLAPAVPPLSAGPTGPSVEAPRPGGGTR